MYPARERPAIYCAAKGVHNGLSACGLEDTAAACVIPMVVALHRIFNGLIGHAANGFDHLFAVGGVDCFKCNDAVVGHQKH